MRNFQLNNRIMAIHLLPLAASLQLEVDLVSLPTTLDVNTRKATLKTLWKIIKHLLTALAKAQHHEFITPAH